MNEKDRFNESTNVITELNRSVATHTEVIALLIDAVNDLKSRVRDIEIEVGM